MPEEEKKKEAKRGQENCISLKLRNKNRILFGIMSHSMPASHCSIKLKAIMSATLGNIPSGYITLVFLKAIKCNTNSSKFLESPSGSKQTILIDV